MTLDEVRNLVKEVRQQGLQIQSHYKRLEQEYSDWEDRVNNLDKILIQAEDEFGLTKKEIINPTDPMLDGLPEDLFEEQEEFSITGSEGNIT